MPDFDVQRTVSSASVTVPGRPILSSTCWTSRANSFLDRGRGTTRVERRDEGVLVHVRVSKSDQEGAGRLVAIPHGRDRHTCPVAALDEWLTAAAIVDGAVFRSVNRHGTVGPQRLSAQSVSLVIKRAAERAGFDPTRISGHSLRAGFATSAAANGASESSIANQTGHRSMEVLRRYVRHGNVFTDNAVTSIGL